MILLCGLPGSGKTTLAKRLANEVPAVRLSPDEWLIDLGVNLSGEPFRQRLEGRFRTLARDLLGLALNVVPELVRRFDASDSAVRIPRELLAEYEQYFQPPDEEELTLFDHVVE